MGVSQPNILLIVVDCARADRYLAANRRTVTPHFDRLCAASAVADTCIVEKACTTPSFSSLLTARYSPEHGVHTVWGYQLPDSVELLTNRLADAGYHTYAEATGPLLPEMGLNRGFKKYEYRAPLDYLHTSWGDDLIARLRGEAYQAPWFVMLHLWELHPERQVPADYDKPDYGADSYERSISALDQQLGRIFDALSDDTVVIFTGDHGEKLADEPYLPGTAVDYARQALLADDARGLIPADLAGWAGPSMLQQFYGVGAAMLRDLSLDDLRQRVRDGRRSAWRDRLVLATLTPWLTLRDLFALGVPRKLTAMIKRAGLLDANRAEGKLQRLLRRIGQDRLLDMHLRMWLNSFRHNLDEGHMLHVYDALVRVPLVIRWPQRLTPQRTSHMVRQVDILPTLLDLLGLPTVDDAPGRSLQPLFDQQPWTPKPAFVSVSGLPRDLEIRGVRTEQWKFSYGPHNAELPIELYDLQADPRERVNLATQQPQRCDEMRSLADDFCAAPAIAAASLSVSADEQGQVEARLRALGYLE